ncbi:hypothetical protein OOU_Y34scaffold00065g6 [Pyricularia oryzae Y34]|uniref:Uncharacterized protein n=2 Tax=Pyricularia oryzae TaxID=318829 RepID=A0AA97PA08_PYRO3|nr:hypothetical protein OOU_Y34scaffold00065g6 [Pyricularia oryzae Y34]
MAVTGHSRITCCKLWIITSNEQQLVMS